MLRVWCVSVSSLRALALLVDHDPFADQVRDLHGEPRSESQRHKMCQAETGDVAGPQRCEVLGQADLPTPVHLCGLSVKFGNRNLGCGVRVRHGNIELYLELVAQQLVDKPTSAGPSSPVWVGLQAEPVVVRRLVLLDEVNERLVLLLQPLGPQRPVPRPRVRLQQRDLRHCLTRGVVCHVDPVINERWVLKGVEAHPLSLPSAPSELWRGLPEQKALPVWMLQNNSYLSTVLNGTLFEVRPKCSYYVFRWNTQMFSFISVDNVSHVLVYVS